jgi:Ca-activated chloride channel family protein
VIRVGGGPYVRVQQKKEAPPHEACSPTGGPTSGSSTGPRSPRCRRPASGAGVGTTTIGFGEGFDEELITEMAEAGGGRSYFAATPDDAPGIFAREFEV